jgi:hypothetical protein
MMKRKRNNLPGRAVRGIVLAGLFTAGNAALADRMPVFSWDTLPRYMHVRKATAFTPEEVEYLASFPLITFEKTTGMKDGGSTEKGTWLAAKAVKDVNPRTKIIYYRNILVHYPHYLADDELTEIQGALLSDKRGNTKLVRGRVGAYDLSNPAVQKWWLDNAEKMCRSKYIDGLFVDGNIKVLEQNYLRKQVGDKKKAAVEKAYHKMMEKLPRTIGRDKIIIANILRARFDDAGLDYLAYFDGSYIEQFEHNVAGLSREEYMARGINAIQTAARKGNIIAFTMGMGTEEESEMGIDEVRGELGDAATVHRRFTYALDLFLICAEQYSYFLPHDGYGIDGGRNKFWMKEMPEFTRPLGAPKGAAKQDGWIYTREFEHARVTLDIENERAEIRWEN